MPAGISDQIFIKEVEIEAELQGLERTASVDAVSFAVSLDKLTDRSFELLLYFLYRAGGSPASKLQYDNVHLLPEGADRGRDVVLLYREQPTVVIQCKKHAGNISLPEVLREISRLILASMVDPTIVSLQSKLNYIFAVSSGISEPAQNLFNETARVVKEEVELIRQCAIATREKYKSLHGLDKTAAADYVVAVLSTASLQYLASEDLEAWLLEQPNVYAKFFAVRTVVETLWIEQRLAALTHQVHQHSAGRKATSVSSWYHPSAAASFGVVARSPGIGGGAPIVLDDVYVPRKLEASVDEWLSRTRTGDEGVMVVVIAPGGYGKTSLLWHYHRSKTRCRGVEHCFSVRR